MDKKINKQFALLLLVFFLLSIPPGLSEITDSRDFERIDVTDFSPERGNVTVLVRCIPLENSNCQKNTGYLTLLNASFYIENRPPCYLLSSQNITGTVRVLNPLMLSEGCLDRLPDYYGLDVNVTYLSTDGTVGYDRGYIIKMPGFGDNQVAEERLLKLFALTLGGAIIVALLFSIIKKTGELPGKRKKK